MIRTSIIANDQFVRVIEANGHCLWSIDDLNKLQLPNQYKYILDIFNKCEIRPCFSRDIGIVNSIILNNNIIELIDCNDWRRFNNSIKKKYHILLTKNNNYHKYLQDLYNLKLKENKITYIQENMNMRLEDKDYISENKILKNQINDQEEIIKQLLERLEVLDKKDQEKNKNTLFNMFT